MMPDKTSPRRLRVFLCHSSGDKPAVRDLYRRLREDGFDPWLDEEDLLPGQDWQREIPLAVRQSDIVVICLSNTSTTKAGYIQKELKFALDVADGQPEGTIFIIPVKLEECEIPERLSRWHWVNLFQPNGYDRLVKALKHRADTVVNTPPISNQKSKRESLLETSAIDSTDVTNKEPPDEPFVEKTRRIDAAVPSHASINRHIDLLVQVRLPESPPLGLEDWPQGRKKPASIQQTQAEAPLEFPADRRTGQLGSARLMISLVAPDFEVEGERRKVIDVPPDRASRLVKFLLAARRAGECKIDVEVYKDDQTYLGTVPLETVIGESLTLNPSCNIANLVLVVAVNKSTDKATELKPIGYFEDAEAQQDEPSPEARRTLAPRPSVYKQLLKFLTSSQGIIIAFITAAATLVTGYWQFYNPSGTGEVQYTGRVINAVTQHPIANAKVSVETQGPPQTYYTDTEGVFNLKLPRTVDSARIRVEAGGYELFDRNVAVSRTGVEYVRLSPITISTPSPTPTPTPLPTPVKKVEHVRPRSSPTPRHRPINVPCSAEDRLLDRC